MNSFGPSSSQSYPLYDPRSIRENRQRFRRDSIPMLDRANSLYIPTGKWPVRGWVLLARRDYDKIDKYSTTLRLDIGDPSRADNVGTLQNLSIVQAQCVTRGIVSSSTAVYLVELTDARGVLCNRWFQFPLTAQYNIRTPAYPDTFHPASMEDYPAGGPAGKTTWTWATMLRDIWERMDLLGAWPGLPYAPAGTPEGFWFTGTPAWTALCGVLDYLGMTVACDLTQSRPYTIVSSGAEDAAFTALQVKYRTHLEDDLEWIDVGAGRVPRIVVVLFRRRNSVYGTEETVTYRSDGPYQWDMSAVYSVSVDAPAEFASAVGIHHLRSDFTVRYDVDNAPLAEDVATADAIARERVTQYFDNIYTRTLGSMSQIYAGALPFAVGSMCDGVCYYQDYIDQDWQAWKTKIVRGASPPWPGVWDQ